MGRRTNIQLTPPKTPQKGRARVWHPTKGQWIDLGPWGSAEADMKFRRIAAEYVENPFAGYVEAKAVMLGELLTGYLEHLDTSGASRNVVNLSSLSAESLSQLYGDLPVSEFGPVQLTTWCASLLHRPIDRGRIKPLPPGQTAKAGLSRSTILQYARIVKAAFGWGIANDVIRTGETRLLDLERTDPLSHCRTATPPKRRLPVSWEHVSFVLPELTPTLQAAVRVQWLTGMRSGELLSMRPADIHRSGQVTLPGGQVVDLDRETDRAVKSGELRKGEAVWLYVPRSHKTGHHGKFRAVPFLPAVQAILTPLLNRPAESFLFSPRESMREFRTRQRADRATPVQPSQVDRRKAKPRKGPGAGYKSQEYGKAIRRACERAGIPVWMPHQIRHSAGTRIADTEGNLRGSQSLLGHASPRTTEGYAKISFAGAVKAAGRLTGE